MAYAPPTKADFIEIYPLFAAVSDPAYAHWSTEAVRRIVQFEGCLGDGMAAAAMLATAHLLTKAGIGSGTEAEVAAQGASMYKSIRSGSITLDRFDAKTGADGGDWSATSYGQELWPMLRACIGVGVLVSSSGFVEAGCGYNGFAGPIPPWQGW